MNASFLNNENYFKYLIPILLVVINFVLKIIYLETQSIANDEPFSIFAAQMDVSAIFSELTQGNNPPFFEIMLHFWIKIFGISPLSVRFLPFLFSVLSVIVIYKIGRSFFNNQIALFSTLIFTFSNYHLYFSHETRVYSFFCLLTCVSMYSFLKVTNLENQKKYWILLILANTFLIYSHYFGLFVPIIQGICVLGIKEIREKNFKNFVIATGISLIFYIPLIPIVLKRFFDSSKGTWVPPCSFADFYTMLWRFSNVPVLTVLFIVILLTAAFKKLVISREKLNVNSKVILIWFLFPYLLMFIVSLKYWTKPMPIFMDRYVIFIAVAFYFSIAIALNFLLKSFQFRNYVYLVPIALLVGTFNPNVDNKRHVKPLVEEILRLKTRNSKLIISPEYYDLNIAYYIMPQNFHPSPGVFKDSLISNLATIGIYAIDYKHELSNVDLSTTKKLLYLDAGLDYSNSNNIVFDSLNSYYGNYKLIEFPVIFKLYVFEK